MSCELSGRSVGQEVGRDWKKEKDGLQIDTHLQAAKAVRCVASRDKGRALYPVKFFKVDLMGVEEERVVYASDHLGALAVDDVNAESTLPARTSFWVNFELDGLHGGIKSCRGMAARGWGGGSKEDR